MAKMNKDDNPRTRKWTIMVYMAAEKNADLDAIAVQDLREMERGANDSAHVVVQINRAWPDSYQRYEVRKSAKDPRRSLSRLIASDNDITDTGEQKTLEAFLTSVPTMFPAEHYFLVLWGHAYGLGFGRDHNNALTLKELQSSLKAFRDARHRMLEEHPDLTEKYAAAEHAEPDGRLELLGTNACAMSYVEAAWELRNSARYMVASQISVPFAGWPYESILRRVPDVEKPSDLGQVVVDLYVSHYNSLIGGERVAMSLLNLQGLEDKTEPKTSKSLKELIEEFAVAIQQETRLDRQSGGKGRGPVRDVFIAAAAGDVRPLIDLQGLCKDFGDVESGRVSKIALEVQSFIESRLLIGHDEHPDFKEELKGIGIFAPFVTDEADLTRLQLLAPSENGRGVAKRAKGSKEDEATGQDAYKELDIFGPEATWPRLVYDDLRQEISTELTNCIVGLDASSRQDRSDVTQIILAIDSTFNKLDRVLSAARDHIEKDLRDGNGAGIPKGARPAPGNGVARRFGQPWLKLIQPVDLDTEVQVLTKRKQLQILRAAAGASEVATIAGGGDASGYLETARAGSAQDGAQKPSATLADGNPALVDGVVGFFAKMEKAIAEVERATKRGLTHPRLGLGPAHPGQFGPDGPPKMGLGPDGPPKMGLGPDGPPKMGLGPDGPPKMGLGPDGPPKMGLGEASQTNGFPASGGDLRVDLALARVAALFHQVGDSLKGLERATLEVEALARSLLADAQAQDLSKHELLLAASQEISRALRVLEDASADARRTVRRVLGHPMYGIGPGDTGLGLEERQTLASAGGLDRRNLRLL